MSRQISIGFQLSDSEPQTRIEIRAPYFLLGGQSTSIQFWSLPRLQEIGITRLAELGVCDPVYFVGWDCLADLRREIGLLQEHLESIEFEAEIKASWLSHLVYCYSLLVLTAPKESTPVLVIG
jgi:hypothetical protein